MVWFKKIRSPVSNQIDRERRKRKKITWNGRHFDRSNMKQCQTSIENLSGMIDKKHLTVTDIIDKDGITVTDNFSINYESEKQKTPPSWFLKQKIFFGTICDNKLSSSIFLISLLFAMLSGCSVSLVIIFLGRIKHILLTNESTTLSFLNRIYQQIIVMAFVIVLAVVAHFGMRLSTTVLSDKIGNHLKQRYDGMHSHKHLSDEIITKVIENINLIVKGLEIFGMQCRNIAIFISSLIICFCHETRLSLLVLSALSLIITLNIVSKKFSKKSEILLSDKISQTIQLEKDLLLLKTNITNDERLMKLSSEVRNCTRYAILNQIWKNSHSGILSFTVCTFIGCGMLYGGYLLHTNQLIKKSDIFIIVLSMALIIDSISSTFTNYYQIQKAFHAALYIRNLQQFDHQCMLNKFGSRRNSMDEITVTLITVPEFKKPMIPSKGNSIVRFINGIRNVLRNYHNHKLFFFVSFILAIICGLEQAAYNIVMGKIFTAFYERNPGDTPNIHALTFCAIQLSGIGFAVFIVRIASTTIAAVVSEHMAVSFHIILSRHLLKMADKEPLSKLNVNTLVDENVLLTSEAKSLYYPYLSELMTRIISVITNIILGFIYSWEIALLGFIFIIFCLSVQIKMEFETFTHCCKCAGDRHIQKKTQLSESSESSMFRAVNFLIVQTSGFILKTICYALTAFICYHKYKHQTQAFVSIIALYAACQGAVQLPNLIRKLYKSWHAVHRIFACMQNKSSKNCMPSISRTIRLEY